MSSEPLLAIRDLEVRFRTGAGTVRAVDGVSLDVGAGEVVALVGESGCGKSVTARTAMCLTRAPNAEVQGSVRLRGHELLGAPEEELRRLRGARIAIVLQDALGALNPVQRVGDQIAEQVLAHERVGRVAARDRAVALLEEVGIGMARERARSYPHELSGGMRQRVLIAMALSSGPDVLIADEPTTGLDVTVQAEVLERLRRFAAERGGGILLVTHDLAVVAEIADRAAVMYAGRIVEQGGCEQVFHDPQHPYTWGLLGSIPRMDRPVMGRLPAIRGAPPSLAAPPAGCHFRPRCPHEFAECTRTPPLEPRGGRDPRHQDRCWLPPNEKRDRREVAPGTIGLADEGAAA